MTGALILHGGPGHDFGAIAAELTSVLDAAGMAAVCCDDPHEAVDRLDAGGWSLLVVHALRWRMAQARYAAERAALALALDPAEAAVIDGFVRRGGGLLALHTAVLCFDGEPWWRDLCGAAWDWSRSSHPPLGRVEVAVTAAGSSHPIVAGLAGFVVDDEAYGFLDEAPGLVPLLQSSHGGRAHPLLWARTVGAGRVVTDLLGHDVASLAHPVHRTILSRAVAWAGEGGPPP